MSNFFCKFKWLLVSIILCFYGLSSPILYAQNGSDVFGENMSPSSAVLELRNNPEGEAMLRETLQAMVGNVDDEAFKEIMHQLDEMEGPGGEEKRKEFDALCSEMMAIENPEDNQNFEEKIDKEIDAQVHLEDEMRNEEKVVTDTTTSDTENVETWLDVLARCTAPLSKREKRIFRAGLFDFEATVKSIQAPSNILFDSVLKLQIQAEGLAITLHKFQRPLQMRFLFAADTKETRDVFVATIKELESLVQKLQKGTLVSSPQETTAFLRGWENRTKSRDTLQSVGRKGKHNKPAFSKKKMPAQKDLSRGFVTKLTERVNLCNEELDKIVKNPKLAAEEAAKKKIHKIQPWIAKKYPQVYSNYQSRLNKASPYDDGNYGSYDNQRFGEHYGAGNEYDIAGDINQGRDDTAEGKESADRTDKNKSSTGKSEKMSEELAALVHSKPYRELLSLDGQLQTLNLDSVKKLSEVFLTIDLQELLKKTKEALREKRGPKEGKGEQAFSNVNDNVKIAVKKELQKIYRPLCYLHRNVQKFPAVLNPLVAKEADKQRVAVATELSVLPFRQHLSLKDERLQKGFGLFIKNPSTNSLTNLQELLFEESGTIAEKMKYLEEILALPEIEPNSESASDVTAEKIKQHWDNFSKQSQDQAIQEMLGLFGTMQHGSLNLDILAPNISACVHKVAHTLFDYPASRKFLDNPEVKKSLTEFLVFFSDSYRDALSRYFISEKNINELHDPLEQDSLAVYKLLSNFDNFNRALGYVDSNIFSNSMEADQKRIMLRSVVLLNSLFGDQHKSLGDEQIKEDLQLLDKTDGWDKIFQNFKVLLNFDNYKHVFTRSERRRLWAITSLPSCRAIPYPYLSWCRGDLDHLDTVAFDLYRGICDYLATTTTRHNPEVLVSNFKAIVDNLNGYLRDLVDYETNKRFIGADQKKGREMLARFIIETMQRVLTYNKHGEGVAEEAPVAFEDSFKDYEKLLYAIDMIYAYPEDQSLQTMNSKNELVEFLAFRQVETDRDPAMQDYDTCVVQIEGGGQPKSDISIKIDILKKIFTWFLVIKFFDPIDGVPDSEFIKKLSDRVRDEQYVNQAGTLWNLKKAFFTSPGVSPLYLLLELYCESLLLTLDAVLLQNIWDLCDGLDKLREALLVDIPSTDKGDSHQDKFIGCVDRLVNGTDFVPDVIQDAAKELKALELMKAIKEEFATYVQSKERVFEKKDKEQAFEESTQQLQEILACIEGVQSQLESYAAFFKQPVDETI